MPVNTETQLRAEVRFAIERMERLQLVGPDDCKLCGAARQYIDGKPTPRYLGHRPLCPYQVLKDAVTP